MSGVQEKTGLTPDAVLHYYPQHPSHTAAEWTYLESAASFLKVIVHVSSDELNICDFCGKQ